MWGDTLHTGLAVSAPPKGEPVTRELARAHLRVDAGSDDPLIDGYISTARDLAEKFLNRALLTQTLVYTISRGLRTADEDGATRTWRRLLHRTIELPRAPVQSVTSIVVLDSSLVSTTLDPSNYLVDVALEPARIRLDWQLIEQLTTIAWPIEHIQITYKAGYADDNSGDVVPKSIIHAILLTTAFFYEHRGDAGGELPDAATRLLWNYRLMSFGD